VLVLGGGYFALTSGGKRDARDETRPEAGAALRELGYGEELPAEELETLGELGYIGDDER
jgi:hypothetical protein